MFQACCCAQLVLKLLRHSVVFVKDVDVILTIDYWRVVVNFVLTAFEVVVTTLHEDLARVKELARRMKPNGELRQVDLAMSSFEVKLANLKRYLSRADRRRGLINAGGLILKALFGTATVLDLDVLHSAVDELHRKQDIIVHSMNQQVTYFKQLDGTEGLTIRLSLICPLPLNT
jgi:mannitol-specific phosphotransferase system IIBC component